MMKDNGHWAENGDSRTGQTLLGMFSAWLYWCTLPYWAVPFEVFPNIIAFPCVKFQNRITYNCVLYYFLIYKHHNSNQLKWVEGHIAQKVAAYSVEPPQQVGFQLKIKSIYGFR